MMNDFSFTQDAVCIVSHCLFDEKKIHDFHFCFFLNAVVKQKMKDRS